jgi:Outer membrane protein beta-barrel domain
MKYVSLVLMCIVSLSTQAQLKEWGIKGGLQLAKFQGDDFLARSAISSSTIPEKVVTNASSVAGYTIGAYIRGAESVFLQGEALISVKGAQLDRMAASGKISTTIRYGQLDLPLSLGFRHKTFEITGGPLLSIHLFNDDKLYNFLSQYAINSKKFTPYRRTAFGYHIGMGLTFNRIGLQARYATSLQNVTSAVITYPNTDPAQFSQSYFQQAFGSLQFSVSYRIK